jgi:hypothetical protein
MTPNSIEQPKSTLSDTAKEVAKQLKIIYGEFRKDIEELKDETIITLANKIVEKNSNEDDVINFNLALTRASSNITQSVQEAALKENASEEQKKKYQVIAGNYIRKIRNSVTT